MVAAATHALVQSANLLVQGQATEEKLISSAKQVASSTAQLLVACKVKASPDSVGTQRLQVAGNTVIRSTDNLVKAARQALSQEEEHKLVLHQKKVGSIAQVIDARAEVLRIEKELEEARKKLAVIHKAKYHGEGGGVTDESDVEYDSRHDASRYVIRHFRVRF
jgi:talin